MFRVRVLEEKFITLKLYFIKRKNNYIVGTFFFFDNVVSTYLTFK